MRDFVQAAKSRQVPFCGWSLDASGGQHHLSSTRQQLDGHAPKTISLSRSCVLLPWDIKICAFLSLRPTVICSDGENRETQAIDVAYPACRHLPLSAVTVLTAIHLSLSSRIPRQTSRRGAFWVLVGDCRCKEEPKVMGTEQFRCPGGSSSSAVSSRYSCGLLRQHPRIHERRRTRAICPKRRAGGSVPDGVVRSETDPLRHRAVLLLRLGKLLLGAEGLVALPTSSALVNSLINRRTLGRRKARRPSDLQPWARVQSGFSRGGVPASWLALRVKMLSLGRIFGPHLRA